jgi:D-glycerate 3-kinase
MSVADYPAYQLYTAQLRRGIFGSDGASQGRQLRLVVGRDRRVMEVVVI